MQPLFLVSWVGRPGNKANLILQCHIPWNTTYCTGGGEGVGITLHPMNKMYQSKHGSLYQIWNLSAQSTPQHNNNFITHANVWESNGKALQLQLQKPLFLQVIMQPRYKASEISTTSHMYASECAMRFVWQNHHCYTGKYCLLPLALLLVLCTLTIQTATNLWYFPFCTMVIYTYIVIAARVVAD